jgi:hypothetical protein
MKGSNTSVTVVPLSVQVLLPTRNLPAQKLSRQSGLACAIFTVNYTLCNSFSNFFQTLFQ